MIKEKFLAISSLIYIEEFIEKVISSSLNSNLALFYQIISL